MKIGILSCGHTMPETAQEHGDFPQMFARLLEDRGFTFVDYDVENMVFPDKVTDCDGWLLTGSKHGAYDPCAFIAPLETFIRDAYKADRPMVGICFGHQIIAQALGGTVEKFDKGWALGLTDYQFDGLGDLRLNAWHQDQVITRPDAAQVVASNAFCENAALVYGGRAFTVQPHPEFDGAIMSQYAQLRRGTADYPDALIDNAANRATQPSDNAILALQITQFFKHRRYG